MSGDIFDTEAWLRRIGYIGDRTPGLDVLARIVTAQSQAIPFENIDVLLGRVPRLDIGSLQAKLVTSGRGGYCFELNALLRAGLRALGFSVTGLIARIIRGLEPDASGRASHMMLRVDLPEGVFFADVGYGNLTPTAPLARRPDIEQHTPHEPMRLLPVGDELTLQARFGDGWQSIYRISPHPPLEVDYEVGNWYTATHPSSPFTGNMIAARPGPDGARFTFLNGRVIARGPDNTVERTVLEDPAEVAAVLRSRFGLVLAEEDLTAALETLDRKGTRGDTHPAFG